MSALLVAGASIYLKLTVVGAMIFGMSVKQVEIQIEEQLEAQELRIEIEKLEKPEPKLVRPKK